MIRSFLQGRFMRHPLHPAVVHLPVGIWMGSLIFDIAYFVSGNPSFARAAYYCIALGIISAVVAVLPGLAEYISIPNNSPAKSVATLHMTLNLVIALLFVINFFSRRGLAGGAPGVTTVGLFILSAISVVLLAISGYLGGLLVYNYGIGLRPLAKPDVNKRRAA